MKVDQVTRGVWQAKYEKLWQAFNDLFQWHLVNAPSPEEVQLRTVMDMSITVINLFIVTSPELTERELRQECLDFIENMRRAVEADDLKQYTKVGDSKGFACPAGMEEHVEK